MPLSVVLDSEVWPFPQWNDDPKNAAYRVVYEQMAMLVESLKLERPQFVIEAMSMRLAAVVHATNAVKDMQPEARYVTRHLLNALHEVFGWEQVSEEQFLAMVQSQAIDRIHDYARLGMRDWLVQVEADQLCGNCTAAGEYVVKTPEGMYVLCQACQSAFALGAASKGAVVQPLPNVRRIACAGCSKWFAPNAPHVLLCDACQQAEPPGLDGGGDVCARCSAPVDHGDPDVLCDACRAGDEHQ